MPRRQHLEPHHAHLPQLDQLHAAKSLEHLPPQAAGMLPLQLAIGIGHKVGHGVRDQVNQPQGRQIRAFNLPRMSS